MRSHLHGLLKPITAITLLLAPAAFTAASAQTAAGAPAVMTSPVSPMPAPAAKAHHSSRKTHRTAYHHKLHHKPTGAVPTTTKQ
jgi:hypothetical protein